MLGRMMQHRNRGRAEVSIVSPPTKHLCLENDGIVISSCFIKWCLTGFKQVDVVLLLKIRRHAATIAMHQGINHLYFIIDELFCNSLITLLCIAKEALLNKLL